MKEISDVADIRMYEEKRCITRKWSRPSGTARFLFSSLQIVYTNSPNQSGKSRYKILNWEETKNKKNKIP